MISKTNMIPALQQGGQSTNYSKKIYETYEGGVMPLTEKGKKIKRSMNKQYGKKKAEKVFYASKNKGTISGVDKKKQ